MSYQRLQNLKHSLATELALKPSWKVYFYLSGTTTPTDTYTTHERDVAHDNPVEADSGGILPDIYFDPAIAYKAVVKDENDVQQGDAIDPVNDFSGYARTADEVSAGVTPTNYAYAPGDVRRYGATGDGATNDAAAINYALSANDEVYCPPLPYLIGGTTLTVPAGVTIWAYGAVLTWSSHVTGVSFTASTTLRSRWFGGKLVGATNASYNASGIAMKALGTAGNPPTNMRGPVIEDAEITEWGNTGIEFTYTTEPTVRHCRITECGYIGIAFVSSVKCTAADNYIGQISPGTSSNAYGVTLTRANYGATAQYPMSSGVVRDNTIEDVPIWKGIDAHGGEDIVVSGNKVLNCYRGISFTQSQSGGGVYDLASQRCSAIGNQVVGAGDGTAAAGIEVTGGYDSGTLYEYADDCIIADNVITGHGLNNNTVNAALRVYGARGAKLRGNTINLPWGSGISLDVDCIGLDVSGNTVIDVQDNNNSAVACLSVIGPRCSAKIEGNTFVYSNSGAGTYEAVNAVRVDNVADLDIELRNLSFFGIDATHLNYSLGTTTGVSLTGSMVAHGSGTLSGGTLAVTFAKRFPATPVVVVSLVDALNPVRASSPSATGFTATGTGTDSFSWFATT